MTTAIHHGSVDDRILQEFRDEARDVLNEIDVLLGNLRSHTVPAPSARTSFAPCNSLSTDSN